MTETQQAAEFNPFDPANHATGGGLWDGKTVTITSAKAHTGPMTRKDGSAVLDEKTKQRIQKRIDKEVGKRKALEQRIAELEAQRQQPPAPEVQSQSPESVPMRGGPTGNPMVDKANTVQELDKLEDLAHQTIGDVQDALDNPLLGREPEDTIKLSDGHEWTRQALLELRKSAREVLRLAPKKRQAVHGFETQRHQATEIARKEFEFLRDKSSPEYQQAQVLLRDPWVQQNPNAEWFTAVYVRGLKALAADKAADKAATKGKTEEAAKPKPKVVTPPLKPTTDQTAVSSTGGPSRASPDSQRAGALNAERAKYEAKGGVTQKEAASLLMRAEQLRTSR